MVALPDGLQIGDVVAEKFKILRVIGSGAMGVVVAAEHLHLERTVALKFLVAEALAHPDALARFAQEARGPARIASPHVVRVNDVAFLASGTPYIELEYLEGSDLAARLRAGGRLPVSLAVDFILQACEGVAEAHRLGIIHRDLKPANLFVVRDAAGAEVIKVLDFGISKARASVSSTQPADGKRPAAMSTSGGPIGSPCYMSPEQMQAARDVDVRTDVWSLGVTLCELVMGELPFRGQSLVELYAEVKSQQPLALHARCPDVPLELESVLSKCLQFERSLRFSSVAELARALAPFSSKGTSAVDADADRTPADSAVRSPVNSSAEALLRTRVSAASEPVVVSTAIPQRMTHGVRIALASAAALTLASWIVSLRAGAARPSTLGEAPTAPVAVAARPAQSAAESTALPERAPPSEIQTAPASHELSLPRKATREWAASARPASADVVGSHGAAHGALPAGDQVRGAFAVQPKASASPPVAAAVSSDLAPPVPAPSASPSPPRGSTAALTAGVDASSLEDLLQVRE